MQNRRDTMVGVKTMPSLFVSNEMSQKSHQLVLLSFNHQSPADDQVRSDGFECTDHVFAQVRLSCGSMKTNSFHLHASKTLLYAMALVSSLDAHIRILVCLFDQQNHRLPAHVPPKSGDASKLL